MNVDFDKIPWAEYMEKAVESLSEFRATKIVIAARNEEGEELTCFFECSPYDLFALAGAISSEGIWLQIDNNGQHLKEVIEKSEDMED